MAVPASLEKVRSPLTLARRRFTVIAGGLMVAALTPIVWPVRRWLQHAGGPAAGHVSPQALRLVADGQLPSVSTTVAGERCRRFWNSQVRRREGAVLKHVALEQGYDRWQRRELLSTAPGEFYEDLSAAGLVEELSRYDFEQGEAHDEANDGCDFIGIELVPEGETA